MTYFESPAAISLNLILSTLSAAAKGDTPLMITMAQAAPSAMHHQVMIILNALNVPAAPKKEV